MPTTREVDAAKTNRVNREARFYTPDLLGQRCSRCPEKLPAALVDAGVWMHPCCDPDFASLVDADQVRSRATVTP